MSNRYVDMLAELSTPHLADACLRVGVPVRCAPAGMRGIATHMRCFGRALPVRHVGSVDIFLEAFEQAQPGDILVVDNDGRTDEACVGDLITLEAKNAGLGGIVIWGLHTSELLEIGLPLFSSGTMPTGPQRLHPRSADSLMWARVGPWIVTAEDIVVGDADGVVLLVASTLGQVVDAAIGIRTTERNHAQRMREGTSFRAQTKFAEYVSNRKKNPAWIPGASEEHRRHDRGLAIGESLHRGALERIIREIRRRTRVVGAFPDDHSALMLAAARLRHIASTKWGKRRYIVIDPLLNPAKQEVAA